MSTEQTNSRKGKIQIPEGWSPTSEETKVNLAKQTNEEREAKIQEILGENVTNVKSLNHHVVGGNENYIGNNETIEPEDRNDAEYSLQTETADAARSILPKRMSGKQRKESLEEYRETFLQIPKLEDRKPVFISREVRDSLDEIARKLGGRGRSVSGFIENLARHHLAIYHEDVESWKKL